MLREFREFATRGNVVDLAVGFIMGGAFGTIVKSLVDDVIMPPIGLLIGEVDFPNLFLVLKDGKPAGPYASLAEAKAAGAVTMNIGVFINTIITFVLVAAALFVLVRAINRIRRQVEREEAKPAAAPTTRDCPYCLSRILLKATRCAACTSQVAAVS
jgi:large conductance mechanosensitive channel